MEGRVGLGWKLRQQTATRWRLTTAVCCHFETGSGTDCCMSNTSVAFDVNFAFLIFSILYRLSHYSTFVFYTLSISCLRTFAFYNFSGFPSEHVAVLQLARQSWTSVSYAERRWRIRGYVHPTEMVCHFCYS